MSSPDRSSLVDALGGVSGTQRGPEMCAFAHCAPNVALLSHKLASPPAALSLETPARRSVSPLLSSLPTSSLVPLSLPKPSHHLIPSSALPYAPLSRPPASPARSASPLLLCRCFPPLTSSVERQRLSEQIAAVQRVQTAVGLFARVLPCTACAHIPLFTRAPASPRGRTFAAPIG